MGKRLIVQARGKGGPRYRAPSFRYVADIKHVLPDKDTSIKGVVKELIRCPGHSAPIIKVAFSNNTYSFALAPEGIAIGDEITVSGINYSDDNYKPKVGDVIPLKLIDEGTLIHNIEVTPGDGGKLVRASGSFAKIITKLENGKVKVLLPSKKTKILDGKCRAAIGIIAGGGRKDKPILKAGKKYYMMKAKNKLYPRVSANAMNAVDHPFGNTRSARKAKNKPVSRYAPPGRKVGLISPKRTGKKKK